MPLVYSEKPSDLIACRINVSCGVARAIPHVFCVWILIEVMYQWAPRHRNLELGP